MVQIRKKPYQQLYFQVLAAIALAIKPGAGMNTFLLKTGDKVALRNGAIGLEMQRYDLIADLLGTVPGAMQSH